MHVARLLFLSLWQATIALASFCARVSGFAGEVGSVVVRLPGTPPVADGKDPAEPPPLPDEPVPVLVLPGRVSSVCGPPGAGLEPAPRAKFHSLQCVVRTVSCTPPPGSSVRPETQGSGSAAPLLVQLPAGEPLRRTVISLSLLPAGISAASRLKVSVIGSAVVPVIGAPPEPVAAMRICWPNTVYPFSLGVVEGSLVSVTCAAAGGVTSVITGVLADGDWPGSELNVSSAAVDPLEVLVGPLVSIVQSTVACGPVLPSDVAYTAKVWGPLARAEPPFSVVVLTGEVHGVKPLPSSSHSNVALVSGAVNAKLGSVELVDASFAGPPVIVTCTGFSPR